MAEQKKLRRKTLAAELQEKADEALMSTNHLQKDKNSSRESVSTPPGKKTIELAEKITPLSVPDELFERFNEYIVTHWGPHAVATHIAVLCGQIPQACPPTFLWKIPSSFDVSVAVANVMQDRVYLETLWPTLKMMMDDNVGNLAWTAGVATSIALFQMAMSLPETLVKMKDLGDNGN